MLRRLQGKLFSNIFFLGLGYFGPTSFRVLMLVALHGGDAMDITVSALCVVVFSGICGWLGYIQRVVLPRDIAAVDPVARETGKVERGLTSLSLELELEEHLQESPTEHRQSAAPTAEESGLTRFRHRFSTSITLETFGLMFDAARSFAWFVRVYYLEDLVLAALMQILAGIRPSGGDACGPLALVYFLLSFMHLVYLVIVRPYANPAELGLTVVGAVIQLAMALIACLLTFRTPSPEAEAAFGWLGFIQNWYFFAQLIVLTFQTFYLRHRRRVLGAWRRQPVTGIEDAGPLLQVDTLSLDPTRLHPHSSLSTTRQSLLDTSPPAAMGQLHQEKPSAINPLQLQF